jgi:hypothetical protein
MIRAHDIFLITWESYVRNVDESYVRLAAKLVRRVNQGLGVEGHPLVAPARFVVYASCVG